MKQTHLLTSNQLSPLSSAQLVNLPLGSARLPQPRKALAAPTTSGSQQRSTAPCAATKPNNGVSRTSKRLQQLIELDLDSGWGVQPVGEPGQEPAFNTTQQGAGAKPATAPAKPARLGNKAVTGAAEPRKGKVAKPRSPYVDLQSEQGVMGMALLQQRLQRGEAAAMTADEIRDMKAKIAAAKAAKGAKGARGLGAPAEAGPGAAARAAGRAGKRVVYVDDDDNIIGEEEEDQEVTDTPSFSLVIGDTDTEFSEYDKNGNVIQRSSASFADASPSVNVNADVEDEEEELDFSGSVSGGWQALGSARASGRQGFDEDEDEEVDATTGTPMSAKEMEALLGSEGVAGSGRLLQGREQAEEQEDWGLDEIRDRSQQTLMEQLGVVKRRRNGRDKSRETMESVTLAEEVSIQWGGTGLSTPAGSDIQEQEALLKRMFKPHKVKELLDHQVKAYEASLDLKRGNSTRGKFGDEARLHKQLRVVAGSAANRRLISSQGSQTRPMMEKVRAAIFNMILSQAGSTSELPPNTRWLDLFAGTGSVGIEALSRGAALGHFVEMDPWICRNILGPNLKSCGFQSKAVVHSYKAENFLRKARDLPRFAGGAFDFISMCPPYLLVSYPELFQLLEGSPLIHENTILFVEYPKQLSDQVPDTVSGLIKVRDRKYGRTWIAVYAPPGSGELSYAREENWDEEI